MTITANATYHSFKIKFRTSQGNEFWAVIDETGAQFFDHVSSSGTPEGKPIVKSVDDLLDWIGNDGDHKPFRQRIEVTKVRTK